MKKIILFSLLAICSVVAKAQDNYADAVKAYMEKNQSNANLDLSSVPADMVDDIYDCIIESFKRNNVTIEELNEASALGETEAGKKYAAKAKLLQSEEAQTRLQKAMMPALTSMFMMGGDPKPINTPEVSASYKKKFHEFCMETDATSIYDTMFESLGAAFANQPDAEEMFNKIKNFFSSQGENMLLVMSDGIFTEEDLDYGISVGKNPAVKHISVATKEAVSEIVKRYMSKMQ